MRISWTRPAMADLEQMAQMWESFSPGRWPQLLDLIVAKVTNLETFPNRGQRELLLAEQNPGADYSYVLAENYKIIYRVSDEIVYVMQVLDTRSAPTRLRG